MKTPLISLVVPLVVVASARAGIVGVAGGIAAPAPTLGPYTMTPFPFDPRPLGEFVTSVPSPLGGELGFSIMMIHLRARTGWSEWSHGYTGDVYWTLGQAEVTLNLPDETRAFYLYGEPNAFSPREITATADDGTSVTQVPEGTAGARYYGFYLAFLGRKRCQGAEKVSG